MIFLIIFESFQNFDSVNTIEYVVNQKCFQTDEFQDN